MVDPDQKRRAATYNPGLDVWDEAARPPWRLSSGGRAHWTGTELVFVEPRGAARRGLAAYDPLADDWRTIAPSPINEVVSSAWAGDALVVISAVGRTAAYVPAADTWTELPPLPLPEPTLDDQAHRAISLHSTGEGVVALTGADHIASTPLDLDEAEWGQASVGPLPLTASHPLWTGDAFVFLTAPDPDPAAVELEALPGDARYQPEDQSWTVIENPCGIDTSDAVWADPLILSVGQGQAYDPATDQCYTLPVSPWAERAGALRIWTGHELLELSGTTDGKQPGRGGIAYDPFPDDDALGVAVDKPSRPVRVRVPSLGIDLPIVWDGRKVRGASAGAVPCDVALTWSPFDLPGAPGTSWVLAHAQAGMFLPLLETLNSGRQGGLARAHGRATAARRSCVHLSHLPRQPARHQREHRLQGTPGRGAPAGAADEHRRWLCAQAAGRCPARRRRHHGRAAPQAEPSRLWLRRGLGYSGAARPGRWRRRRYEHVDSASAP